MKASGSAALSAADGGQQVEALRHRPELLKSRQTTHYPCDRLLQSWKCGRIGVVGHYLDSI